MDNRNYTEVVKVIFKGVEIEVACVSIGGVGPVTRIYSRDEHLIEPDAADTDNFGFPAKMTPLGVEFNKIAGPFNDAKGYAGLPLQDYIDKLGLRSP